MSKAKQFQTVELRENVAGFNLGDRGAVVEVYTTPYEAYDVEMVDSEGRTHGLVEGLRPEQIELVQLDRQTTQREAIADAV